jgi:signal transduction histidine kinase
VSNSRSSLSLRISLLAVSAAVITALIGGLIALRLVNQAVESGARQTLSRLADEIQTDLDTNPNRAVLALRALKVDVGTIGPRGRVASSGQFARDALSTAQIQSVLAGQSVSSVQGVDGQTMLVEARPTSTGGVVVVQPRSQAIAPGTRAGRRLLVALAIACGIAVLLGVVVSRRLARPLRRLADAAHAMARGHRNVAVEPEGPSEVAEVADALNVLAASLARSEARQRDFLLSVSHDLRTPLTSIRGYAESLADGMIEADQVPRVGGVVVEEANRLDRYVSDLLDLARLDATEVRIDLSDIDLESVVESAAAGWAGRCSSEGVDLVVERAPSAVPVRSDPARVRQVLDGLLENALRVVPAGRPVVLASRVEQSAGGVPLAVVEVRDGGPGLTDDDIVVAFERFALYERYKGIRRVGTGLGLAIVQQLVTRLGGTIEAGHAHEGGARFTVRLPPGGPVTVWR